jgi:hypothetical protein
MINLTRTSDARPWRIVATLIACLDLHRGRRSCAHLADDARHYLASFASILLAIAYVREKDKIRALQVLDDLHIEFPANTSFPHEIARLQSLH